MAVLILTTIQPLDAWFRGLITALEQRKPDIDLRVWPECENTEDIDVILAWLAPKGMMQNFPNLKLIMSLGASVDTILDDEELPENVPIVRLVTPTKSVQMAEYVTLAVLMFQRRFLEYLSFQRQKNWELLLAHNADSFKVGILGQGVLGLAVSQKLIAMGFPVRGWSRTPKSFANIECFHGRQQLTSFLSECSAIVCLLPVTSETKGILCKETFDALPDGAFLINVGQGPHVVEADLLSALDSGKIAGACLDVFKDEPLPPDHRFWTHPNVIVTPHISAPGSLDDVANCVIETLTDLEQGQPLKYGVDRSRGY